jgi:hypothetical protein
MYVAERLDVLSKGLLLGIHFVPQTVLFSLLLLLVD